MHVVLNFVKFIVESILDLTSTHSNVHASNLYSYLVQNVNNKLYKVRQKHYYHHFMGVLWVEILNKFILGILMRT